MRIIGDRALLFTDIEASTALLQRVGHPRYVGLLDQHHRILRAAIEQHEGHEIQNEGDSFVVLFASVGDAVAAAITAQHDLRAGPWPADGSVSVRMGVHEGEVGVSESGHHGLALHEAARVADAAHGGQILVSDAARARIESGDTQVQRQGVDRVSQPVRYIRAGAVAGRSLGRGQIGIRVGDRSRGCMAIPQLRDRGTRRRRARHRGWQPECCLFATATDRHRQPPSLGAGPRPRRIGVGGTGNGGSRCGRRARQAGRRASTIERFRAPRGADRTSRRDPASDHQNSGVSRRQVGSGLRFGEPLEGLFMSTSDLTIATDPDALGQYLLAQHESSRSGDDPAAGDQPEIHRDPDQPEIHRDPDQPEIHRDPDQPADGDPSEG